MGLELRIKEFVDNFVLPRRNPLPNLPHEYRLNSDSGEEWDDWIEIYSSVTDEDLKAIENKFKVILPDELKFYFKYKIIFNGDFGLCRFPDMRPDKPLENLISQIGIIDESDFFRKKGLLPFAQDGNDGGAVCFKYDQKNIEQNLPIYLVDHELIHTKGYEAELLYGSFIKLIEAIEIDMAAYD